MVSLVHLLTMRSNWKTVEIKQESDDENMYVKHGFKEVKEEKPYVKREVKEENPYIKQEFPKKHIKTEHSEVYRKTLKTLDFIDSLKRPRVTHSAIKFEDNLPKIKTEFKMEVNEPPTPVPIKVEIKQEEIVPDILPEIKVCAANYDAVQVDGQYGLIHTARGYCGEEVLIVHTPRKKSKEYMLALKEGDDIQVYNRKTKAYVPLTIRYTTRYRYFSPGTPITMIQVGVDGWV